MNYNLKRYDELKEIISKKEFDKIGTLRDCSIIKNSDLKDKLLKIYLQTVFNNEAELELVVDLIETVFGIEILQNEQFCFKYSCDEISMGNLYEKDDLMNYLSSDKIEQITSLFLEKIKDPEYQIRYIPKSLKEAQNFIDYCLENKNLSILNFIEYKEEYLEKAQKLIREGYGFTFNRYCDDSYQSNLMQPLLEAGYVENFNFFREINEKLQEYLEIIKKHIKNGKKYSMGHNVNLQLLKHDQEFINLLIETNQLDFINVFSSEELEPYMEKIIQKVKEGYRFKKIDTIITNSGFLKILLETNQLNHMNRANQEAYNNNSDLFKKKLKEGQWFKLDDLNILVNAIKKDSELLELLTENNLENLLVLMEYINHHEDLLDMYNKEFYQAVKISLANEYHLNLEHLDRFVNRFGPKYLYYLKNNNLKNTINLSEEDFDKYMNLFSYDTLNLTNAHNIYDSILQARFKSENKYEVDRLTRIKDSITNSNLLIPLEDLTFLANKIDENSIKKLQLLTKKELDGDIIKETQLLSKEELEQLNENSLKFLMNAYNKIKNKEEVDKNLTIIYEINRQYLRKKREEYRAIHHYEEELELYYSYDENSLLNVLISDLCNSLTGSNQIISQCH